MRTYYDRLPAVRILVPEHTRAKRAKVDGVLSARELREELVEDGGFKLEVHALQRGVEFRLVEHPVPIKIEELKRFAEHGGAAAPLLDSQLHLRRANVAFVSFNS